jgi:hypothetical protein
MYIPALYGINEHTQIRFRINYGMMNIACRFTIYNMGCTGKGWNN